MTLHHDRIRQHAARPVPRYTSYPTAPHFHAGIDRATYRSWLAALPERAALSLYFHIPFCDTLCWFCGCHTKITRQYAPIAAYLEALLGEIDGIAAAAPAGVTVRHIHWGGGSPTILAADDTRRLMAALRQRFTIDLTAEFAVEVDPRGLTEAQMDALAESGLTRVSIGVQDFDPMVQAAINRIQTFEETNRVVAGFRARGVRSLNIDAIYGLPGQQNAQLARTLDDVIRLDPDRIALFGYAHVPWMKRHQTLIPAETLPDVVARHAHAEGAAERLVAAGYHRIGIDHFAKPGDSLAIAATEGRLQRNFQGYTVDPADALIGLGASAIGRLPQGFVQNETAIALYQRAIAQNGTSALATVRGVALTPEDELRGAVIERLMCDLRFSKAHLLARYGRAAEPIVAEADAILRDDVDGFVLPTDDGFAVTDRGRPFLRTIAARFDAYLGKRPAGHSLAV
jgi:oxygen-independent coproporphyrinogen-3 oxidase